MEEWRSFLYPLGFLSSIAFGTRFIIQWLQSEKAHRSIVPRSFWQISLLGNILLLAHSFVQVQFHICVIQVLNAIISWRNLNLIRNNGTPLTFKSVCFLMAGSVAALSAAFAIQDWWILRDFDWFRIPLAPWQSTSAPSVSFLWHTLGAVAFILFSSRFWIQWVLTERAHQSYFPPIFWWLSLTGALLSIAYFFRIGDTVNLVGPFFGLLPYIRNLMLQPKLKEV